MKHKKALCKSHAINPTSLCPAYATTASTPSPHASHSCTALWTEASAARASQ